MNKQDLKLNKQGRDLMKFFKKKVIEQLPYNFKLKDDEFIIKTQFHAKTTAFIDFFNKMSIKAHTKERFSDIKKECWELDEKSKAAVENKLLKAINFDGIIAKEKQNKGLEKLKPVYVKLDKVEYEKNGLGYDVKITIKGLQTGVV